MEVKVWHAKFGCPVCNTIEESEGWWILQHLQTHTKEEVADTLVDIMRDAKLGVLRFKGEW